MKAIVEEKPKRFKAGCKVKFLSLAGRWVETTIVCAADNGSSVYCADGNYLPMRLFGIKWGVV